MRISLSAALLLTNSVFAWGDRIAPPPPAALFAGSDVAIVGKVTKLEEKSIKAMRFWGGSPVEHRVAVVKIDKHLRGAKGLTHLRVAFVPGGFRGSINLDKDQRVCLLLHAHPKQSVFVLNNDFERIIENPKAPKLFNSTVEKMTRFAKLMEKPLASLQSRVASDRFMTAAMLIWKYRSPPGFRAPETKLKSTPIPKEESRLILKALAEADWQIRIPDLNYQMTPAALFARLGIGEKDGFRYPNGLKEREAAMKKWIKDNMDRYRIQRWTIEK